MATPTFHCVSPNSRRRYAGGRDRAVNRALRKAYGIGLSSGRAAECSAHWSGTSQWLVIGRNGCGRKYLHSSNQNVPLISGLPGTLITLIAIRRVRGPATKSATCSRQPVVPSRSSVLAKTCRAVEVFDYKPGSTALIMPCDFTKALRR
jgi:hypothetical protein